MTARKIKSLLLVSAAIAALSAAGPALAAGAVAYKDGSYTGSEEDAYYGLVQVQANVQGGQLISVDILQSPDHSRTSRAINRQALPLLERSVIRSLGTRVNMVSGATLTSRAFLKSFAAAIGQAR